tara:strand:- start:303 stop:458 length:156 start_codon:yes stop_codon:yes gene_type:complete
MIGEYLFYNDFPKGVRSIYCNGKTYTREQFLIEKEKFLKRKAKRKNQISSV